MFQTFNLIERLKAISDYRKSKGKRHALWLILLGSLCGYCGYRPLEEFSQQYWSDWRELLELGKIPVSHSSIFDRLSHWALQKPGICSQVRS